MPLSHSQLWSAIDGLARREGMTASGLARRAGLDATSFNPSKRFGPGDPPRPRWPSTESLTRILQATGVSLGDFATLAREEADALRRSEPQRRALAGRLPFTGERDVVQATRSFELAIQCYQQRQTRPPRLGGLYHRLAWLAREQGDVVAERTWLAQALAHYQQVYLTERLDDETTELTLQYLIGELHLRLGQVAEARRWFSDLLRHPALAKKPYLATMVRDRWEGLRAGEIPAASRSEA